MLALPAEAAERAGAPIPRDLSIGDAASATVESVFEHLCSSPAGLAAGEAEARVRSMGPNALRTHHAQGWLVLARQFRNPLLILLIVTASVSFFTGDRSGAAVIAVILALSVGLGFVNEYRAEKAAEELHSQIRHTATALRDGRWKEIDVTQLVPGDVIQLTMGEIVPADVRLASVQDLECDEAVLTGESMPAEKRADPCPARAQLGDLTSCALMGTLVRSGEATAVVVATGGRTEFGRIALALGERQPQTEFQRGLRRFSLLLVRVAAVLTTSIFVVNLILHRPLIDALLFSLAIAVGITPQLLPAVVTTCLATGSRRLARKQVLVKRLVVIEDLGNFDLLITDKTGTLTAGSLSYEEAVDIAGAASDRVLLLGLLCNEATVDHGVAVSGNPLDVALWQAPAARAESLDGWRRVAIAPFDHDRRMVSALADAPDGTRVLITKGAPESVLPRCAAVPETAHGYLERAFAAGMRTVAIATRPAADLQTATAADEHELTLAGFLAFLDPPKPDAAPSIARLNELGIAVKIATGDNPRVAEKVCADLGITSQGTLTGEQLDELDDDQLAARIPSTTIFARISPEHKARIIRMAHRGGVDVAFLGDGVNDAAALHEADVGISVDTATDVAKDAAGIILLEKDLGVLADGVAEGRRIFANTIKYVLMSTSSNFGNMFSAAAASAFLPFLPMLPLQILLNNLLYDTSQMSIPTDTVDTEMTERPEHWDIAFIRRFMIMFGPISSIFDFVTFAVLLSVFHAGESVFQSGWFVESLATQTLIIFAIRTRRVPFLRSRPSTPLLVASLSVVAIGALLPLSPLAHTFGFHALPVAFYGVLVAMLVTYLLLVEAAKRVFYGAHHPPRERPSPTARKARRLAWRWSLGAPLGR